MYYPKEKMREPEERKILHAAASLLILTLIASTVQAREDILNMKWNYSFGGIEGIGINDIILKDIDNDGLYEVVVGTTGSAAYGNPAERNGVYAFAPNGTLKWYRGIDDVLQTFVVEDINRDRYDETIISSGQVLENIERGEMHLIRSDGFFLPLHAHVKLPAIMSNLKVVDFNNDQYYEILGGASQHAYVFDSYGSIIVDFKTRNPIYSMSTADVEEDGGKEIVLGSDKVYFLDPDGRLVGTFDIDPEENFLLKGVKWNIVSNLTNIRGKEILAISKTNTLYAIFVNKTYIRQEMHGNQVKRWIELTQVALKWRYDLGVDINTVLVTNLDDDPYDEFLLGAADGNVYAMDNDGNLIWTYNARSGAILSLAVADIDGDKKDDILVGTYGGDLDCIDKKRGFKWRFDIEKPVYRIAVMDLDNNQLKDIILGLTGSGAVGNSVEVYELNEQYTIRKQAEYFYYLGQSQYINSDYYKARVNLVKARDLYTNISDIKEIEKCQSLIVRIDVILNEDKRRMADTYYSKAYDHYIDKNYDKAREFAMLAKNLYSEFGDNDNALKCELLILRIDKESQETPQTIEPISTNRTLPPPKIESGGYFYKIIAVLLLLAAIAAGVYIKKRREPKIQDFEVAGGAEGLGSKIDDTEGTSDLGKTPESGEEAVKP